LKKRFYFGEMWFALFIFSGYFKGSVNLVDVDLTILFLILTGLSSFLRLVRQPDFSVSVIVPFVLYVILTMLVILSYFYAPNTVLMQEKTFKYLGLTTPAFLFVYLLIRDKKSLKMFLAFLSIISLVLSIISFTLTSSVSGFVGFNDGNYLGLGRINGIGLAVIIFLGVFNSEIRRGKVFLLLFSSIIAISLLSTGGRMPVISVMCAALIVMVSSIKIKNGNLTFPSYFKKTLLIIPISIGAVYFAYKKGIIDQFLNRFLVLFYESSGGSSSVGRLERYYLSFELWKDNFVFGTGFGGFGFYYTNDQSHDYPHNLFLEMLSELGLLGFMTITVLVIIVLIRCFKLTKNKKIRNDSLFITTIIVSLIIFINAMVSGDVNENRILFTFLAILSLLPVLYNSKNTEEIECYSDENPKVIRM